MSKYQVELSTTKGDFTISLDHSQPMTLANITTSPGMLVSLAVKTLNNQGNNISDDDVINASITKLEDN